MERIYFNHGILIGSPDAAVKDAITEIAIIKEVLGSVPLCVSIDFWSIPLQSTTTLLAFLSNKKYNRDSAIVIILTLMNNGPHFPLSVVVPHMTILPAISQDTFAFQLMHTCFNDKQEFVLSLKDDKILTCGKYILSIENRSQDITNLIGKESVYQYIENRLSFTSIDEVFQKIERENPFIEILESALKMRGSITSRALLSIYSKPSAPLNWRWTYSSKENRIWYESSLFINRRVMRFPVKLRKRWKTENTANTGNLLSNRKGKYFASGI